MRDDSPMIFGLGGKPGLAARVAAALGLEPSPREVREFEDGEHKARPLVSVRERDVYVVDSLYGEPGASANDKLCRLLFFVGALRDASARRVTALVPYLCYARKDRRTKGRDPVTTRYVAALFEAAGVDRVVTLEVHNLAAFENAFRCRTEHLEPYRLYVERLAPRLRGQRAVAVSPDVGGIKRLDRFREVLAASLGAPVPAAFMEKRRSEGEVSGEVLVGDVSDAAVVLIDDLISTGTTLARAAHACHAAGAKSVYAAAAHGLFTGAASAILEAAPIDRVLITDSVPPFRLEPPVRERKLELVEAAPLFAEAIRRLNRGDSLTDLREGVPAAAGRCTSPAARSS